LENKDLASQEYFAKPQKLGKVDNPEHGTLTARDRREECHFIAVGQWTPSVVLHFAVDHNQMNAAGGYPQSFQDSCHGGTGF